MMLFQRCCCAPPSNTNCGGCGLGGTPETLLVTLSDCFQDGTEAIPLVCSTPYNDVQCSGCAAFDGSFVVTYNYFVTSDATVCRWRGLHCITPLNCDLAVIDITVTYNPSSGILTGSVRLLRKSVSGDCLSTIDCMQTNAAQWSVNIGAGNCANPTGSGTTTAAGFGLLGSCRAVSGGSWAVT